MKILEALLILRPQSTYRFNGLPNYKNLIWEDEVQIKPTLEEIDKTIEKIMLDEKKYFISEDIQKIYLEESTKNITYKDVLYKGGDASASAIVGAVELAQSLQETEVKIIGSDDKPNIMSFSEALELSGLIAKAWRTAFFRYKELKVRISNATTVEELESISWEEVYVVR